MKPAWVIGVFFTVALVSPLTFAQQTDPYVIVRISRKPKHVFIGQHTALLVDVLFRGEMPRPPRVTIPDMRGTQVFRFETQETTISDNVNGESYTGQRFEFAVSIRAGAAVWSYRPLS